MRGLVESKRIPVLDGWRGIAILLVLFNHTLFALRGSVQNGWAHTGQHGVTIFFVLSGFLITTNLVKEPLTLINLKRFYIRRFLRLMPVAWIYLAVLVLINLHTRVISLRALLASLIFYRNFSTAALGNSTAHFWSLSLEEQFYLVWPGILCWAGIRKSVRIATIGAVGCALYRWTFWAWYNRGSYNAHTQVRCDALLVGALTALMLQNYTFRTWATRWSKVLVIPSMIALLYAVPHYDRLPPLFECVSIASLILASTLYSESIFVRPLILRPLTQLGVVSYSIYVWHPLLPAPPLLGIILPLVAGISYIYVERPCIRLGHWLTSSTSRKIDLPPVPV
jgi:peptidoglycan/LPS O-acetylase OafA/YrhL